MQGIPLYKLQQRQPDIPCIKSGISVKELSKDDRLAENMQRVAPALLEVYADDSVSLERLIIFHVNLDHVRQALVWNAAKNS